MSQRLHTVLLVDDEEFVRTFVRRILEREGYEVLDAPHGEAALTVMEAHASPVHLLLTDVRMAPHMGGAELAAKVRVRRPETRILYMSGYSDDPVVCQEVLNASAEFLAKPFGPSVLKQKVKDCLAGVVVRPAPEVRFPQ